MKYPSHFRSFDREIAILYMQNEELCFEFPYERIELEEKLHRIVAVRYATKVLE
jgi:hypothetical protein